MEENMNLAKGLEEKAADAIEAASEKAAEMEAIVKETLEAQGQTVAEEAAAIAEEAAEVVEEAAEAVQEAAAEEAPAAPATEAPSAEVPADKSAESMENYSAELEASFRKINEGDILTGTVIGVSETEITLDLGYYTDGLIRLEDASDDPTFSLKDSIKLGETISATVIRKDDGRGHILLSMKAAADVLAWDRLKQLKESQENVTVKISGVTRGGAVAYLEGIRGFIPASKLALNYVEENDLPNWLNKSLDVRVITAEQEGKRLVMSAREILREKEAEERRNRISNVEVGLVTEGTVETLKPYGAFINLGNGLSGLLHVSQISQQRIKHPADVLKEGQNVKVKIIANKEGKLSLSMKALEDVAAEAIEEETIELPKTEAPTTSLGSLFAKLNLK